MHSFYSRISGLEIRIDPLQNNKIGPFLHTIPTIIFDRRCNEKSHAIMPVLTNYHTTF
jgi:hypothetical protein